MRRSAVIVMLAAALATGAATARAQSREYRVVGTVVDTDGKPVAGAVVEIREQRLRTAFRMTADGNGVYKLAGLPHGTYDVKISKPGFTTRTDVWNLAEEQDTLKRVEFKPYVMLSEGQVAQMERDTRLRSELDDATRAIRAGDTAAALATLEKMVAERPDDANANFLIGLCRLQNGELQQAAAALTRAVELAPSFAPAHNNLAICYEKLKDTERALASYAKTLAIDPANAIALYNSGALLYNSGKAAEALPYFERMLTVKPDDDRSLEMAGYCELQALHYAKALGYLERARPLITDPERATALDGILKDLRERAPREPGGGA